MVDLWLLDTKQEKAGTLYESVRHLLPQKERDRSNRMLGAERQREAMLTRIFLRTVLSLYHQIPPQSWRFSEGRHGKPFITEPDISLEFNLSHSGNRIAVAISRSSPVGVDIELENPSREIMSLAKRYYSPTESSLVMEGDRTKMFFSLWTLKEASTKAMGLPLGEGLNRFEFQQAKGSRLTLKSLESGTIGVKLITEYLPYYLAVATVGTDDEPEIEFLTLDLAESLRLWGTDA